MSDWRQQEVENETRSREINEWIDESNESSADAASPFVCECSDGECTSTIHLTHVEYEEVRAHGTHFAIATDHESPDLDLMVSERIGFAIIRKLPGSRRGSRARRILGGCDPHRSRCISRSCIGSSEGATHTVVAASLVPGSDPRCLGGRSTR